MLDFCGLQTLLLERWVKKTQTSGFLVSRLRFLGNEIMIDINFLFVVHAQNVILVVSHLAEQAMVLVMVHLF